MRPFRLTTQTRLLSEGGIAENISEKISEHSDIFIAHFSKLTSGFFVHSEVRLREYSPRSEIVKLH